MSTRSSLTNFVIGGDNGDGSERPTCVCPDTRLAIVHVADSTNLAIGGDKGGGRASMTFVYSDAHFAIVAGYCSAGLRRCLRRTETYIMAE